jgi:hypothetical protein
MFGSFLLHHGAFGAPDPSRWRSSRQGSTISTVSPWAAERSVIVGAGPADLSGGVATVLDPCQDGRVAQLDGTPPSLATLVDHMFDAVLESHERAQLLSWIEAWDAANPHVDNAHRITGWIDVAYAFQARLDRQVEIHDRVRTADWAFPALSWDAATA